MQKSPLSPVTIREISLHDAMFECFKTHGHKKALINGLTGKTYTYRDVDNIIRRVASGLYRLGVRRGDIVAFFSYNSIEYIFMLYGVLCTGATVSTINPSYTAYELSHNLKNCQAAWIFTIPSLHKTAMDAVAQANIHVKGVIVAGNDPLPPGTIPFASLESDDGSQFPSSVKINVREDIAIVPYSSGTTGLPKGVMLTHYNIIAMMSILGHADYRDNVHATDEQPILLSFLPVYHVYGMMMMMIFALAGGMLSVCLPRYNEKDVLSCIEKYKVTSVFLVPPVMIHLSKSQMVSKYDLSSVKRVGCGAAPLGRDTELDFQKVINVGDIRQGFGMTETTLAVLYCPYTYKLKPGSVGLLAANTEGQVMDVATGQPVGPNQRGELCVRGPQIMKGYLHNTEATRATIDEDGWLHTGDICYYDDDGYFFIVDRIKELIKYKGFQVAPAELETLILTHPSVADVAVIGVPDATAGELPRAYVVVKSGMTLTEDQIKQFVAEKMSNFKQLRGGVVFVTAIPKTETGKILRRNLRAQIAGSSSRL